ncbi:FUSC family protein [Edaphobacter sp. HDX4]|uniref:FUSC family protein n=1 Tax=Edaphobacter sp. HDX4 TaxID=2794064 RepID=UPI002FE654F2
MRSRTSRNRFAATIRRELAPYPGRLTGSLRDTLGIVMALTLAMTWRVPGISLALALLFLMQRERPGLTLRVAVQIFLGALLACIASLFWVQITDGTEIMRFVGVVCGVFVAAFLMAASTNPLFWTIFGFYGFVDLAGWDAHRTANAIVSASLSNVASLGLVVLCAVAVEYAFGTRHPVEDLDRELKKRLKALELFFAALSRSESVSQRDELRSARQLLIQFAHAGDSYLNQLYDRVKDSGEPTQISLGIRYRIALLTHVLQRSVPLGFRRVSPPTEDDRDSCRYIAEICRNLHEQRAHATPRAQPARSSVLLGEIQLEMIRYAQSLHPDSVTPQFEYARATKNPPKPFTHLLPDAFTSPAAAFYALKLTLAATLCYILYNAIAWPGILTCVVTVLFTGLSSTGAMRQKQFYRFVGAAIGGSLAIATVSLLFPNTDSITALILIVAPVAFISGWVLRSRQIGYVGVQIGFAFFLTALPGFSAATQIAPARDRVIGIGLGILVMWFIFDQLWPTRTSDALIAIYGRIHQAASQIEELLLQPASGERQRTFARLRSIVSEELSNMQQLDSAAHFEGGRHRKQELRRSRRIMQEIEEQSARFYSAALRISEV